MINYNIELLKFVELYHYNIDKIESNVNLDETKNTSAS